MYFNILFISQGTKYAGETWDMGLCLIWTKHIKDFNVVSFIPGKYVDHLPIDCSQEIFSVIKSSVKLLLVVFTTAVLLISFIEKWKKCIKRELFSYKTTKRE